MKDKDLVFTIITVSEIVLIILVVIILPRIKRYMASMLLVMGIMVIFITHVIYDQSILGLAGGPLEIRNTLGFKATDVASGKEIYTIVTSLFVHANIMHFMMNGVVLFLLGVPFEEKVGARNFVIIFFAAGVGAALMKLLYFASFGDLHPGASDFVSADANGIGASGAIFGILGAFVALYPREKVLFPLIIIRPWPVFAIALIYAGLETFSVVGGVEDGVGHVTHLNGLLVGIFTALVLKKANLIGRTDSKEIKESIPMEKLEIMARTYDERKMLEKVKKADMQDIRDAWLEHFLENVSCPKCGTKVDMEDARSCECKFIKFEGNK